MPYAIATDQPIYWAVTKGSDTLAAGYQPPNSITFTGSDNAILSDVSENAFLGKVAGKGGAYKPLPDSGWLGAGEIYGYNGGLVIVRQPHNRTIYPPEQTTNLFTVYREGGPDVLEWVAGEKVEKGARRTFGGKTYSVVQPHVTEYDPVKAPALWEEVREGGGIGEWKQPTGAHDSYKKGDRVTWKGSTWESTLDANVWEPGVYGWQKV